MLSAIELEKISAKLRINIVDMIYNAGSGHSGGSLSCIDILTVLFNNYMNIKPEEPCWQDRDRFVLSKGHAAPALYSVLANRGFINNDELMTLREYGSRLQGHPCMFKLPGVDMSTGSLGMGLSVGVGMALSAKLLKKNYNVFVLCGDGELQEGQNWEALMSVSKWKLDNFVMIVDNNNVQLDGTNDEIMPLGNIESKLVSFGIKTISCNGHSAKELIESFDTALACKEPVAIIASTIKGKGVSFMEGKSEWHGKRIEDSHYETAITELKEVL